MGSRRYPGQRHVKGWQLTALVGVAGAVVLAGCSSSGTGAGGGSTSTSTAAPTTNGGSAITGYQVQVATSAAGPFSNAVGCVTTSTTTTEETTSVHPLRGSSTTQTTTTETR